MKMGQYTQELTNAPEASLQRVFRGFLGLLAGLILWSVPARADIDVFTFPGGSTGEVQYNDRGIFDGSPYAVISTTTGKFLIFTPPVGSAANFASYCSSATHIGRLLISSSSTSGQQVYVCESSGNWVQQGGVGGGGGASTLEFFSLFDGTRSSPTASTAIGDSLLLTVSGSTAILNVDISSVTSNHLSLSSATATYLQSMVAAATYLTQSSATATYLQTETNAGAILNQNVLQAGTTAWPDHLYVHSFGGNPQLSVNGVTAALGSPNGLVEVSAQSAYAAMVYNTYGLLVSSNGITTVGNPNVGISSAQPAFPLSVRGSGWFGSTVTANYFSGNGEGLLKVSSLNVVNSNVGSFTNASVTVDAQGRVTAASSGSGGGLPLTPGDTNYIQNTNTLQSGATFYVSSGTVDGQFSLSNSAIGGQRFLFRNYMSFAGSAEISELEHNPSPSSVGAPSFAIRSSTRSSNGLGAYPLGTGSVSIEMGPPHSSDPGYAYLSLHAAGNGLSTASGPFSNLTIDTNGLLFSITGLGASGPGDILSMNGTEIESVIPHTFSSTATFTSSMTLSGGYPVQNVAPASGQVLKFNGTYWAPGTDNNSGGGGGTTMWIQEGGSTVVETSSITFNAAQFTIADVSGIASVVIDTNTAGGIMALSTGTNAAGQLLRLNASADVPDANLSSSVSFLGSQIDISAETNLAVEAPVVLTDDTLSLDKSSVTVQGVITAGTGITVTPGAGTLTVASTLGTSIAAAEIADGDHGDFTYSGGSATLDADVVSTAEMADADHGDFTYSGGAATLDADVVAAAEMADADHGDVAWSGGVATVQNVAAANVAAGSLGSSVMASSVAVPAINSLALTFTNKTIDANDTGNTLKKYDYALFTHPSFLGSTTNNSFNTSSGTYLFGQGVFSNSVSSQTNCLGYQWMVPYDLDTSVALVSSFTYTLGGADTGTHRYVLSLSTTAASANPPSLGSGALGINFDHAGDGSGASGDIEIVTGTLTGWAGGMAAGQHMIIQICRDGDAAQDASTVNSTSGPLLLRYGISQ